MTSAVEKPAEKSSSIAPRMSIESTCSGVISPRSAAFCGDRRGSMPRPSSATVMTTLPPACSAEIVERAGRGLAGRDALLRAFEAVVERVAHEVHERVAERVDHGAVELGVLADEVELDLLAELGREVAHEPREAQEDGLHRDHPDLHDHRLQRVRRAREVLHGLREAGHVGARGERLDLGAVQDELAHEVHQLIEPLGVDADRGGAALGVLVGGGRLRLAAGAAAARRPRSAAVAGASPAGTRREVGRGRRGRDGERPRARPRRARRRRRPRRRSRPRPRARSRRRRPARRRSARRRPTRRSRGRRRCRPRPGPAGRRASRRSRPATTAPCTRARTASRRPR